MSKDHDTYINDFEQILNDHDHEDIPETDIQLKQTAELTQIRIELQRLNAALRESDAETDVSMYECTLCGVKVEEDDRREHGQQQHQAPPGEEAGLFEVIG